MEIRGATRAARGNAAWSIPDRKDLAAVLQNRGNAHRDKADLPAAIADLDAAVAILKGIRDDLRTAGGEAAWTIPYRNDLAMVLQNRGIAHADNGDPTAAIADFDPAVEICKGIRKVLCAISGGMAWSVPHRDFYATVLLNRGNAHADNGDLAAGIGDLDAAAVILEEIRDDLRVVGGEAAWSVPYRNSLAGALQNRGIVRWQKGDLVATIADFEAAVAIREGIRNILLTAGGEAAWSIPYRSDLAGVLLNRGIAQADKDDLAAAIADYDAAVKIHEGIRDNLRATGDETAWSIPYRNHLARVLTNRGADHADNGDLAAAISDFDEAVAIREGIRDRLRMIGGEAAWTVPLRVDLARLYTRRARILGPGKGEQDRGAVMAIANGLKALGRDDEAREVAGLCEGVARQWVRRNPFAALKALHAQRSTAFWPILALLLLLAPIMVPLGLLIRGLRWLRRRIGARDRRR